jgi:hypothetical protein
MKKLAISSLSVLILAFYSFCAPKMSLVGHWTINYKGAKAAAEFKGDGTFRATDEHGGFDIGGKYKVKGAVIYISDTSCNAAYWGQYKSAFFNEDSLATTLADDSCSVRKYVLDGATLTRKKM